MGARLQTRGKYNDIADHLWSVADREEIKAGGCFKTDQFMACALRGFGLHNTALGTGTYGDELGKCIRRQGKSEKDRLWNKKDRIVITDRISRTASSGRFGYHPGGCDEVGSIALEDCYPLGGPKYKNYLWDGDELGSKGKAPHTTGSPPFFLKQKVGISPLLYGDGNKDGRLLAPKHLSKSRE